MEIKDLERALGIEYGMSLSARCISRGWQRRVYLWVKRAQDIVLSALALVLLSLLMALIALAVVVDDPHGPPIFSQLRCGRGGEKFRLYKFRTMCVDAESHLDKLLPYNQMTGPVFKIRGDPRITRLGRFLRATGLDELPQLVNILKGDMSIVGPRPPLPREVAQYTFYQWQRLAVTPGLTCFWQVNPARNSLTFDAWVELDLCYIREQGWLLDWKLIFQTARVVFRREGL
ncbi:sugar transferase [Acutalibacter caecimuris]|uniref:sugar transferase n=1 Tax=Acutalibacter caecimuris TaxID=3093657 RepID=UPI002AC90D25|nr:sugar transferase [Acutalibacter sp. M00118]